MRRLRAMVLTVGVMGVICLTIFSHATKAIDTTMPPVEYYSRVFISAFQNSSQPPASTKLDVIEFYNPTDNPVNLNGWKVQAYAGTNQICDITIAADDVYIPPEQYTVISEAGIFTNPNVTEFAGSCQADGAVIDKLELVSPQKVEETINGVQTGGFARKGLTATYRDEDDDFLDNFAPITTERNPAVVYAGKWYRPLKSTAFQISEIVPRARECGPLETTPDCNDYVKLYNPTSSNLSLDGLRLRIGHQSQNVTASNAIVLSGDVSAGSYGIINKKANGDPLSITDGGGWVWLQDTYGLKTYDTSVVEYPSAGSVSKIGWAWAYDESDGIWKWTSTPTPYNQPSKFTLPVPVEETPGEGDASSLTPCRDDQFRNPSTNRCKLIASSSSSLVACASNQVRNPETHRCKLISSASTSLKPCATNQVRNTETNRCRLIASATSSLQPCTENQKRNPATNRCKKVVSSIPDAGFALKPTTKSNAKDASSLGWIAFAGVASLACGYAIWEWRREIGGGFAKIVGWVKR